MEDKELIHENNFQKWEPTTLNYTTSKLYEVTKNQITWSMNYKNGNYGT
jgi:hypothetical protein